LRFNLGCDFGVKIGHGKILRIYEHKPMFDSFGSDF